MSSAANHAARSHRSSALPRSAFGNLARRAIVRDTGRGAPLAVRLKILRQKVLESRKKEEATEA